MPGRDVDAASAVDADDPDQQDHERLDHGDLRQVVDVALMVAATGRRRRPPLPFPDALRPFLDGQHVSKRALGRLRRAIDEDREFRRRLADGLDRELLGDRADDVVDEIGRLWLARPSGWHAKVDSILDERGADERRHAEQTEARREAKRRRAAEAARERAEADLEARDQTIRRLGDEVDQLRAELGKALEEAAEHRSELHDARLELRHARDRERAALDRLDAAERDRDAAEHHRQTSEAVRDDAIAERVDAVASLAEVIAAAEAAESLAGQLRSLLPASAPAEERPERRRPMSLPGGVISTSAEAAEFFARSDAAVLVDGYNVSKQTWPSRSLEQQRTALLDAMENLARRFGTDLTVVFDGADVVGAHSHRRRLVRVVYSPAGVTADDVIRDEVRRLPAGRHVVVVTDDREIVRDVRSWGANPLPSNAFVGVL